MFIHLKTAIPGPESQKIIDRRTAATPTGLAKSTSVVVKKARGAIVEDVDGNILLDFAGAIGVVNAGHAPKTVVDAVKKQAENYLHTCALVTTYEPYVELCEMLNRLAPGDFPKKTLLANSGAEAVENAVNIARYVTKRAGIIVFEGGYHGRTLLTMTMTSKYALFKKGYSALAGEIYRLPAPNLYRTPDGISAANFEKYYLQQLDNALISQIDGSALAAIVVEPIQGEAGFVPMPVAFLKKLRAICDATGAVLIFDEIQCGMGRTGKLFAAEHFGVQPDIFCTAKSLGSGLPISATTGRADLMDIPHLGAVGGTYGGSPLACAAAIESLKMLSDPAFLKKAEAVGEQIRKALDGWKKRFPLIGDVRGVGAMRLVEFVKDRKTKEADPDLTLEIIKDATANGVILIRAGLFSNCIRFLPPLVITRGQLAEGLEVIEAAIERAHIKRGIPVQIRVEKRQLELA
jgi:4-aminobutyrate aminotransferase / (S)-3-amino-2-methylpropionate transaminase / 5-aminovalerate transaminase